MHEDLMRMKAEMVKYYGTRPEMLEAFYDGYASGLAEAEIGNVCIEEKQMFEDPEAGMIEFKKEWYAGI